MKKYLFIVLLVGVCFGQDIIKYDGKELKGQYISHDYKTIKFLFEGRKNASEFPFDRKRLEFIKLSNGDLVEIRTPAEIAKTKRIENEFGKCDDNKKIFLGLISFKDDFYGLTEDIKDSLRSYCFNVEALKPMKWLHEQNIKPSEISDYDLVLAQKDLKLDAIVYGYVFTEVVQNNYIPTPAPIVINNKQSQSATATANVNIGGMRVPNMVKVDPIPYNNDGMNNLISSINQMVYRKNQANARAEAESLNGTWLLATVFFINEETGEKNFLFKNYRIKRL